MLHHEWHSLCFAVPCQVRPHGGAPSCMGSSVGGTGTHHAGSIPTSLCDELIEGGWPIAFPANSKREVHSTIPIVVWLMAIHRFGWNLRLDDYLSVTFVLTHVFNSTAFPGQLHLGSSTLPEPYSRRIVERQGGIATV